MDYVGEMYRDRGFYGFKVKWEVRKAFAFTSHGECDVVKEGIASSWSAAGKQLAQAMEEVSKINPKEVAK